MQVKIRYHKPKIIVKKLELRFLSYPIDTGWFGGDIPETLLANCCPGVGCSNEHGPPCAF